jgi:hypothetical protein
LGAGAKGGRRARIGGRAAWFKGRLWVVLEDQRQVDGSYGLGFAGAHVHDGGGSDAGIGHVRDVHAARVAVQVEGQQLGRIPVAVQVEGVGGQGGVVPGVNGRGG